MEFRSELRHGLTTAMCLDREQELWLATGTSDGVVACWDLRFGLQVATLVHPAKARVRRLLSGRQGSVSRIRSSIDFCMLLEIQVEVDGS